MKDSVLKIAYALMLLCFLIPNFIFAGNGGKSEKLDFSFINRIFASSDTTENSADSLMFDSTGAAADSLVEEVISDSAARMDSMKADSTARLKYFRYQRSFSYAYPLVEKRKSPFFIYPKRPVTQTITELDSTGTMVLIKEKDSKGNETLVMIVPLDEYINLRNKDITRKTWEELGYKYVLKSNKEDLGALITSLTNIEIPLPSVSFLSIFGPPKINLRINGAVDIHGAWRNETTEGVTASLLGNSRNEPDFKQQVQINVDGTIGDKLSIKADWNTERTFQYENQLKINYTGYDDEIIQKIQAGNVSLQTSPLVGGSEALFGIKADFQFGPFKLTALASQKKGEVKEVSVSGGSKAHEFSIHAYDYSQNHYFLDTVYASQNLRIFESYFGEAVPVINDYYFVKDIEVWRNISTQLDPNREKKGNAFINLPPRSADSLYTFYKNLNISPQQGTREIGQRFIKLTEDVDYILHPETGFVTFKTSVQKDDILGVAYRIEGPTSSPDDDIYFGEFDADVGTDTSQVIVLKMIRPKNLQPQFKQAWRLQLKNIYPVGGRDVKEEGFKLNIFYRTEGQEPLDDFNGVKLLEAFGLDFTDASKTGGPDGTFDFIPARTIIPETGEIIFPSLEPFGKNFPPDLPDSLAYNAVYDTTYTFAKQDRTKDKFLIEGEYSAAVSSQYNIGFNVVENSVRVTLNGAELAAGTDYSVDYNVGQVVIRKPEALVPGADLKISYEQNDLLQLASKTLIGFRGLYEFNKNTTLGFSYLNLNQQTLSDKVRIGEEPLNNTIFGMDFKTNIELPFITKGLDYLFSTSKMSTFKLQGEFAYMSPDPNSKKSTISSDGGKSIAYIDDFEGSKKMIPLGISYTGWRDLSVPDGLDVLGRLSGDNRKMQAMRYKGKSFWFNITPPDVRVEHIWGNRRQVAREDEQVTVLDFVFRPNVPGMYNWNPSLDTLEQNWGGMMKLLSTTANNLIEENIEFIEFWMKVEDAPQGAVLNIDLGQISEDVIPNRKLDSEDKNFNDLIDEGEDLGIDGLGSRNEPNYDPNTNRDPSGDNFALVTGPEIENYTNINGTEGNAVLTDVGRLPDSEDLNRNFTLDKVNSYFRYSVPIDTNRQVNNFIAGGGDNAGWYLMRIPLREFQERIGNPSFSIIEYIRFWISGVRQQVHLRFAELNLVGNQWQKVLTKNVTEDDSVMVISTINIEDNPEYTPPPGVERERDKTKPDQQVYKNEQSLLLRINDMKDGQTRETVKYLFRPLDLFNYREMKLFIHGEFSGSPSSVSNYSNPDEYNSEVYLRFGSDTLNYYEYKMPVRPGWHDIQIKFKELTAIKAGKPDSVDQISVPVAGKEGHTFGLRGKPTLTRVSFFLVGIHNPKGIGDSTMTINGDVWINELRVLDADDTDGWAYKASTSLSLADILNVNFNINQTNPNFHKLADRFGRRVDSKSWGTTVNLNILKLLPFNTEGSNLSINYSHNESFSRPQYLPSTDVQVDEAVSQLETRLVGEGVDKEKAKLQSERLRFESQNMRASDTWSLSNVKFRIPSKAWYIEHTINSLSWGFNYNVTRSRAPNTRKQENWVWKANMKYALQLGNNNFFMPAEIPIIGYIFQLIPSYEKLKIYYTPQSLSMDFSANRKRSFNQTRTLGVAPNIQRDFTATRNGQLSWRMTEGGFLNLSMNYNFNVSSSLAHLLVNDLNLDRREGDIWDDILGGQFFGRDFDYRQSFNLKTSPKLPSWFDLDRYFRLSLSYGVNYNWRHNFQQEELGRSGGYSNNISAGLNINWSKIFGPLFGLDKQSSTAATTQNRSSGRNRRQNRKSEGEEDVDEGLKNGVEGEGTQPDSTGAEPVDTGPSIFSKAYNGFKLIFKYLLVDYNNITFNFSQKNSMSGSGIAGEGTGFGNFWGVVQKSSNGPSRMFMLGLSNDIGPRAPNGNLSDNFTQQNNISFKTSRNLWDGAKINLDWKVAWGMNRKATIRTDSLGNVSITNLTATGTIDRSFLSLPNTLIFSFLGNGVKKVAELYDKNSPNPIENLASAFVEGMESFPWISKIPFFSKFIKYIPRPNWSLSWSGLEKLSFLDGLAQRISLNHSYSSGFSEGWKITPDGEQQVQTMKINYAFSPLIGMNMTFNSIWGGNLTAAVKYSTRTSYNLGISTKNISESLSQDINVTGSFSKAGFEIPLFGLSLKNDLEISFAYTFGRNSTVIYDMEDFKEEGKPQDGTTRTSIEPRIKYVMSSKVTLSLYYKRTSVKPEGAARIPPTTTNEAGLDVHIAIR